MGTREKRERGGVSQTRRHAGPSATNAVARVRQPQSFGCIGALIGAIHGARRHLYPCASPPFRPPSNGFDPLYLPFRHTHVAGTHNSRPTTIPSLYPTRCMYGFLPRGAGMPRNLGAKWRRQIFSKFSYPLLPLYLRTNRVIWGRGDGAGVPSCGGATCLTLCLCPVVIRCVVAV